MPNPHVFVVGCVRSGTTLLQRMLDSHPQLAVSYDCHFIPQAIRKVAEGVDPTMSSELLELVRHIDRFWRLGLPEHDVQRAADEARTYGGFVSAIYDAFAKAHGKTVAGEKAPGYCRHIPRLHALLPWARFVHLIRDGRDIALSVRDWGKGPARLELAAEEPIAAAALWWRRDILAGRRGGAQVGSDRYQEVRYESLVADPKRALRALAAFLGLPFDERMLSYHEGRRAARPGSSAKAAWLPPTPGLRDWRSQMAERDVELFEALAGDVLASLGYPCGATRVSTAVRAVAERCRAWWVNTMGPFPEDFASAAREDTAAPRCGCHGLPAAGGPAVSDYTAVPLRGKAVALPQLARNPYLFIVGCPRSGTTLLKRMLNAHPEVAVTPETHWVARCPRKGIGVDGSCMVTRDLVPSLLQYPKFANLRISRGDVEQIAPPGRAISYSDFVSAVFDLYGAHAGKPLVGDKTPGYVQDMPLLHELWPAARFVHLVRDGRDVCLSALSWSRAGRTVGRFAAWDEDRLTTAALWWERFVRLGREAGEALGPQLYFELRYERLVSDPARCCAELCEFLGLRFDDAMVRFHEGRTRSEPGLSAKKAWLPVTPGIRDWRTQMSPADVERFESAAGALLEELGCPRGCLRPSPEALEQAARMRRAFRGDPRLRKRRLPQAWRSERWCPYQEASGSPFL